MRDIIRALYGAKGLTEKQTITEQASLFDDIALSSEVFPDYCVDVVVEVLSVRELHEKPGIDKFVLNIATDAHRLSETQKKRLLEAAAGHYKEYGNEEFCWLLCDFIARSIDQECAIAFFEEAFDDAKKEGKQGIALGLDVLARSGRLRPNLIERLKAVIGGAR